MKKSFLVSGFLFGITAIILGAFGSHSLKEILSPEKINSFEVGVRYQMHHALLLILISNFKFLRTKVILYLIISGVIIFSFSIYLLSLNEFFEIEALRFLGPITPIGGTILIISWALLLIRTIRKL